MRPDEELFLLEKAGQTVYCPHCGRGVGIDCDYGTIPKRGNHKRRNVLAARTKPEEFRKRGLYWWLNELTQSHSSQAKL